MKFIKQFSVSLMAMAAVTAASAATQPVIATNATIAVDAAAVASGLAGYSINTVGGATYSSVTGLLTAPVQSVATATNPGAIDIELADAAGLKFTKSLSPTITLSNFSFDVGTNELSGNLVVSSGIVKLVEVIDQSVLVAGSVTSMFGSELGTAVTSSSTPRDLGLIASNFSLSQSFKDYMLNTYEMDATQFGYVANMIKEVRVGTVPEPSTYALMGVGLACMGFVARRKRSV